MRADFYTLSATDLVIRGCRQEHPERLLLSMRTHYEAADTYNLWGLSVAVAPGADELGILLLATQIRQSHYRVGRVSYFQDLGLGVILDHGAHGLILSPAEPTIDLAIRINEGFGDPRENLHYEARSRRRASR